jgi:hypothetical protein
MASEARPSSGAARATRWIAARRETQKRFPGLAMTARGWRRAYTMRRFLCLYWSVITAAMITAPLMIS